MNSSIKLTALAIALVVGGGSTAFASGFEKSITWGGRTAGVAGVATPYVQGAEALYFNPAGLVADKVGNSISFDISAISPQFKGPINNNNDVVTSESKLLTPVSLIYGNTLNEKWGFGVGYFVSGGASTNFPGISFPNSTYAPDVKTDLQIFEASAGLGYRVDENLKIGFAWRVVMANADFAFVKRASATGLANAKLTGLKDTQGAAFKLGAQYKVDESTEIGLTWRSEVNFNANGKAQVTGFSSLGGAGAVQAEQDATAHTTFPMQVTLGGLHKFSDDWNIMGEWVWTQYSRVGEIVVDSTSFATTGNQTRLQTDWRDQHNIRIAAEYNTPWPVRFGYVWTSSVTNPDYARASFAPPAPAHTFTLGTGKAFAMGEGADANFRVDGALEYTFSSGDVSDKAAAGTTGPGQDTRNGTYSVSATALHLGLAYMF
ncbi:outer membrane protein transport protein [soil metagenome]